MDDSFHKLFEHQLQDMYDAEKQILAALPKMAEAAHSPELKEGFEMHAKQTEKQIERLEKAGEQLKIKLKGVSCAGMEGLIKEGEEVMKMKINPEAKDAALIVAAQKVEHYEIVAYATIITHAKEMGHEKEIKILKDTLDEEKKTDMKLNELAESRINMQAAN